jgi:hypothetical protein
LQRPIWSRFADPPRRIAQRCGARLQPLVQRVAGNPLARRIARLVANNPGRRLALAVLFIAIMCRFVPLSPAMPGTTLDESWAFGMNQAMAQGLVSGRDIIFTFGPYASIFTGLYHPSTDGLMVFGSAYLAITYWIAIVALTRGARPYLVWCLLAVLAGLLTSRDALLMSYPLLVGVACCTGRTRSAERSPWLVLCLAAVLFSSFGLLPLIKGSMAPICGLIAATIFAGLVFERSWRLAACVVVSSVASMVVFWIAAGQALIVLPAYIRALFPFISGYAEAMAIPGDTSEIVGYLICAVILLAGVVSVKPTPPGTRRSVFAIFAAFLFVAFKAGFVRHDTHALISGTSLLIAGVVFWGTQDSRLRVAVLVSSVLGWMYIDSHHLGSSTGSFLANVRALYSGSWDGVRRRWTTEWPRDQFDAGVRVIKEAYALPVLDGTTDVYPCNQTILLASGNRWNPRPVFQSYAVYNQFLAEPNRAHLLGSTAPDNILFSVAALDGRLPPLEDAPSWPALLALYRPVTLVPGLVTLRRRTDGATLPVVETLGTSSHGLGRVVPVPDVDAFVFAEIEIEPTLFGKLAATLFKPNPLTITVTLSSGVTRSYRYISSMGKLGVLISPLVENTQEFTQLYGGVSYLGAKKVSGFSIAPSAGTSGWKHRYRITFKAMKLRSVEDPRRFYALAEVLTGAVEVAGEPAHCAGNVEMIDGVSPAPRKLTAGGVLEISGWLARSLEGARLAEVVVLVLTDPAGRHTVWKTRQVNRPDIGAQLKDPRFATSGYAASIDVSKLAGPYDLALAVKDGDRIERCSEFTFPVTVTPVTGQ